MKTITTLAEKGGVGKTTVAANAAYLSARDGHKTLLIDLDSQGNASSLYRPDHKELSPSIADFFSQRGYDITRCINPAMIDGIEVENFHVAHSNLALQSAVNAIPVRGPARSQMLANALKGLDYDYVFIDCPPSSDDAVINAIAAATTMIVPVEMGGFAADSIQTVLDLVTDSKGYASPIEMLESEKLFFVLNKLDGRTKLLNRKIEEDLEPVKSYIAKATLRVSSQMPMATNSLKPLALYSKDSELNKDYEEMMKEVVYGN